MSRPEIERAISYAVFNKNGFTINYPGVRDFWVFLGEKVGWGHFTRPEWTVDPDALQLTEVSATPPQAQAQVLSHTVLLSPLWKGLEALLRDFAAVLGLHISHE